MEGWLEIFLDLLATETALQALVAELRTIWPRIVSDFNYIKSYFNLEVAL